MTRNIRAAAILFGLLVLILVIFLIVGSLNGDQTVPATGTDADAPGQTFVTSQVLDDGCPVAEATRFFANNPVYVGFVQTEVANGSTIQARITQDGQVVGQSEEVTADANIQGSCVTFTFPPDAVQGFPPGDYTAEMYVSGELAEQVEFTVESSVPEELELEPDN